MQAVRATLPYIRSDVPILIIFRALGLTADKDILQHVVYDFGDTAMMEALRPSLEGGLPHPVPGGDLLVACCLLPFSQKSPGAKDAAAASQGHHHSLHAASF